MHGICPSLLVDLAAGSPFAPQSKSVAVIEAADGCSPLSRDATTRLLTPHCLPLCRYTDLTRCMDSISLEELIMAVRRQSQGFSRGTSTYRGVTHHPSGEAPPAADLSRLHH